MGLRMSQVDAFSDVPFRGNPAAVCLLPEARHAAFADRPPAECLDDGLGRCGIEHSVDLDQRPEAIGRFGRGGQSGQGLMIEPASNEPPGRGRVDDSATGRRLGR